MYKKNYSKKNYGKSNVLADLPRSVFWALLGIFVVLALEQLTPFDVALQDRLFDPAGGGWLIDPNAAGPRFFFYRLPKMLLWLAGLAALVMALGPASWRARPYLLRRPLARRDLWVFFTIMALVPLTVGAVKSVSRVYCPCELSRYGGQVAYVKLFSSYAPDQRPERPGRCFPAAQASGGFALMGLLAFGAAKGRYRRGFLVGSAAGFLLGFYQMARGAHFASHTLTSWLWAWLLAVLIDHLWPRENLAAAEAEAPPGAGPRRAGIVLKIGSAPDFDPGHRGYRGSYWESGR